MLAESLNTELKREYVDDIRKTVIAFANTDGGTLYIGVEDDGAVCGLEDADGTLLRASNAIRDAIRPDVTLFTECRTLVLDGKPVVAIDIQRGTARPYYLANKGIRPEGVFVRQGASTVPATETAILAMIRETGGEHYENARSLVQQLSFEKTGEYFKKHGLEFGEAQKRTLGLIGEDGNYTNLAFLLSEQCTHTLRLAVFEGSRKSVFKDRRELTGSLLGQLEEAYANIDRFNRTRSELDGLERIDLRDYPPEAVREALLNAVVHRDYAYSGSTLVSLFDDRMEIVSIGGLVRGISLGDIRLGVSVLRNPRLANVFYRLNLIEAYGTGILKMNESYADTEVKPGIEASDNAFRIILPNVNHLREQAMIVGETRYASGQRYAVRSEQETRVLRLLSQSDRIARKDVQDTLGISQSAAVLLLRKLVRDGTLVKEGNGKRTRYRLG